MSRRNRNKRNGNGWIIACVSVLIVIAVLAVLVKLFVYEPVKKQVAEKVVQKMIETELANDDSEVGQDAQAIYDSMTEEEKDSLTQMAEDKMDAKTIKEVKEYVDAGDREGLKNYAKEQFTEDEIQQIKDIYQKYK